VIVQVGRPTRVPVIEVAMLAEPVANQDKGSHGRRRRANPLHVKQTFHQKTVLILATTAFIRDSLGLSIKSIEAFGERREHDAGVTFVVIPNYFSYVRMFVRTKSVRPFDGSI